MSPTKRASSVDSLRRATSESPRPAPAAPVPATAPAGPHPRPEKPVRFTLDLAEDRHAFLKRFAEESGAGVRASQVMRALLDELAEGPNLAAKVRSRIWAAKR
jgi:hypothetical protein